MHNLPKLLVIVGPTASGKSELAISIAKKFNGEIVAADSRTIYKEMNIGTSKAMPDTGTASSRRRQAVPRTGSRYAGGSRMVHEIPHHLIDVVRPDRVFTLAQYKTKALRAIYAIVRRDKLPIMVGGTGLYVQAVIDNLKIPRVPPHARLREELGRKTAPQLYALLKSVDPAGAARTGQHNKRRIIRALEVLTLTGIPFSKQIKKGKPLFEVLVIGISIPREKLYARIDRRVARMMEDGFLEEVLRLRKKLYSPHLPAMSGIGYGEINALIDGNLSLPEAVQRIKFRTHQYARRQIQWFKRDTRIRWIETTAQAMKLASGWLYLPL